MSRTFISIIVLIFISGCVTNAQTLQPTNIKLPGLAYTAMTVEGTTIYYRDLTKPLPSRYRSAARTAPLHHPERNDRLAQASKTPADSTITMTHFPGRPLTTLPPKATRIYLNKVNRTAPTREAGRRS